MQNFKDNFKDELHNIHFENKGALMDSILKMESVAIQNRKKSLKSQLAFLLNYELRIPIKPLVAVSAALFILCTPAFNPIEKTTTKDASYPIRVINTGGHYEIY